MTVMVGLLRGVNVGGASTLPMVLLREIVGALGHTGVRTYIQSGNVVFTTPARSTAAVARELEAAIAERAAVRPDVIVRTRRELALVVERNPFVGRGEDPAHQHVLFLGGAAAAPALGDLSGFSPEQAVAVGRHIYLHLPKGVGRSKLAASLAARHPRQATMRNWRTVTKLLQLADEPA